MTQQFSLGDYPTKGKLGGKDCAGMIQPVSL
jgi:hypothetical protein